MNVNDPYKSITFGRSLLLRVDGAIGAMSLSPNGRDAVLAGRRGLFIIDLDDPFTTPRWLHHITSWEVADVQWSPHHNAKPSWCILTSNQKALLWDLARPLHNAISNVLHKHTRAITDINFHPHDPELLATCSVDTFIYGWDMRCPRRPVSQWAEWRAGTTQVKWNHGNPFEIASLHDNAFYIWDTRKGALPVVKVTDAHRGKINGLDFSGGSLNIITCSNDKTVKFWNLATQRAAAFIDNFDYFGKNASLSSTLEPAVVIHTDFPVARARSLPFGTDMACGIMPIRGGSDSIHIVNYDEAYKQSLQTKETIALDIAPVYSFKGHQGNIKDFLWRTRQELYEGFASSQLQKDYQLVTWSSQDYDLKLWPHPGELYKSVNYNPTHLPLFAEQVSGTTTQSVTPLNTAVQSADSTAPPSPVVPGTPEESTYNYNSYCIEPPVTIDDITKVNKDLLSSTTTYKLLQRNGKQMNGSGRLNHLDWISGVRIGRETEEVAFTNNGGSTISNTKKDLELDDGPSNLGEEVSYVGHKFPKIRFEKISVSTGELIVSLKGPVVSGVDYEATSGGEDSMRDQTQSEMDEGERDLSTIITASAAIIGAGANVGGIGADTLSVAGGGAPTLASTEDDSKLIFIRMEVKFPKLYPHLEEVSAPQTNPTKQHLKHQKQNLIKFNIEETHELKLSMKKKMLENLNEISQFYTNKYNRFCLEPCLRFLMGDKIELDHSLFMNQGGNESDIEEDISGEYEDVEDDVKDGDVQVGSENWADDLINQQPDLPLADDYDENDFEDFDLIPAIQEEDPMKGSVDSLKKGFSLNRLDTDKGGPTDKPNPPLFDSTPVPKGCGAVWSQQGQLVCFFIPKETNEGEDLGIKNSQKFNIFKFSNGGFSLNTNKHHNHHHHHHHHHHNQHHSLSSSQHKLDDHLEVETIDVSSDNASDDSEVDSFSDSEESGSDSNSDSESDTDSNSSDDSFTNDWDDILKDDMPSRTRIPGLFKTSVGLGNRYRGGSGTGSGTGTGTGPGEGSRSFLRRFNSNGATSNKHSSLHGTNGGGSMKKSLKRKRNGRKKNKNIVGIFDLRHLIPDKYELAREYRVLGDSPETLARYNAEIAFRYGLKDIGDVWKILEMILIKDVGINEVNRVYYAPNGVPNAISNEPLNQLIMNSTILRQGGGNIVDDRNYRFYWGTHPFGHAWLVKRIFEYFEKRGNIQMLAMISCILFENSNNIRKNNMDNINVPIHTPYGALPPPPSIVALRHYSTAMVTSSGNQISGQGSAGISSGRGSFDDPGYNNQGMFSLPYDKLNESSTLVNNINPMHQYARSISSSLDGSFKDGMSPDRYGNLRKGIQNIGAYNSLNEFSSESEQFTRTKFISRRANAVELDKKRGVESGKKQIIATPNTPFIRSKARNPPIVTLEMMNTDELDIYEDVYSQSLLSSQSAEKIKFYREQYAELLFIWGLPVSRIKILKFNYPDVARQVGYDSPFDVHKGSFGIRNKIKKKNLDNPNIRFVTPITTSLIRPQAWNTSKVNVLKYCNLCNLLVTKRLVLCVNCEHVLHADCASDWWPSEENDCNEPIECPSGCGCNCLKYRV